MKRLKLLFISIFFISGSHAQFPDDAWLLDTYGALKLVEFYEDSAATRTISIGAQARSGDIWTIIDECKGHYFSSDFNFIINHNFNDSMVADSLVFDACWSCPLTGGIVPIPNNDSLYFVLSSSSGLDSFLFYSIYDANANGGIGKVISKKNRLYKLSTNQTKIIKHQNQKDYWIIARKKDGETPIWLLDSTGIPKLVKTILLPPFTNDLGGFTRGYMDFIYSTEDGNKLIFTSDNEINLVVASFNRATADIEILQKFNTNPVMTSISPNYINFGFEYMEFIDSTKILYLSKENIDGLIQVKLNANYLPIATHYIQDSLQLGSVKLPLRYNSIRKLKNGELHIKTYNGVFHIKNYDTIQNNFTVIHKPWKFKEGYDIEPLSFGVNNELLVGRFYTQSTTQLGGDFNGAKTFDFNNVCLNDTTTFYPVNLDCPKVVKWRVLSPDQSVKEYELQELLYAFTNIGLYEISMINAGDTITQMINIDGGENQFIQIDTTLCEDEEYFTNETEGKGLLGFAWNDGYEQLNRQVMEGDTLTLEKYYSCHTLKNDYSIDLIKNEEFEVKSEICGLDSVTIELPSDPDWNFKLKDHLGVKIDQSGKYSITASNDCFEKEYEVYAEIVPNPVDVNINVITPNGDNLNDSFDPFIKDIGIELKNYSLEVYSKWGQNVFSTKDPHELWNGEGLPSSDYFYLMKYSVCKERHVQVKGNIKLLR